MNPLNPRLMLPRLRERIDWLEGLPARRHGRGMLVEALEDERRRLFP